MAVILLASHRARYHAIDTNLSSHTNQVLKGVCKNSYKNYNKMIIANPELKKAIFN